MSATPSPSPGARRRAAGLTFRVKLMLSYAGTVALAGALLLSVVWLFLLRYVPEEAAPTTGGFMPGRGDLLRAFVPPALAAWALLIVVGLVGGWFLARHMLAPLGRITRATRLAAAGSLSHRIGAHGPDDEVRELADSFDAMLARIEAQVAEQRRFAANASHELRTPLAITRAMLDVAAADPDRDVDALLTRLARVNARAIELTEALLSLSRAEGGALDPVPVDVSLLADQAAETFLSLAESRGVALQIETLPGIARGSQSLLQQLVVNLVHNAIVHNCDDHGWVRIGVRSAQGSVGLCVENSGPVVPSEMLPTLLEPFQRGAQRAHSGEHEGAGLGLAIVAAIVRAHDGSLTLWPRDDGGLLVEVVLPAA